MLTTTFYVFCIIVGVVLCVDFIAAVTLVLIENKLKNKHPDNEGAKKVADVTTSITGDVVYLQVKDGSVKVIDELPVIKVKVPVPVAAKAAAPAAPAAPIADKEFVATTAETLPVQVQQPVADKEFVATTAETLPVQVQQPVAEQAPVDENGRVVFIASDEAKMTYLDKLAAMDKKHYNLYEQLLNYLLAKANVKMLTTNNKGIFKYKTDRLAVASVRRGVVTLQFNLINSSLERYMRAEGVKGIKVTPVTIRLADKADLERAKSTADLTLEYLEQERVYNAEQKKAARREARRAKAEAEKAAAANKTDK